MSTPHEKRDNNNYADHFTRIPNILFDSYKHLTKEEKWLFASLRCLCWDDSTPKYRTLRDLSNDTGFSIGALSKMLPRLHIVGLIHAEIKRKRTKDGKEAGNALYHITIIDIWEQNRQFYSCSPNEQVDPSDILVHQMTQACSPNDTSLFTKSDRLVSFGELDQAQTEHTKDINNKTTLKTTKKESIAVSNDTRTSPTSFENDNNSQLSLSDKDNVSTAKNAPQSKSDGKDISHLQRDDNNSPGSTTMLQTAKNTIVDEVPTPNQQNIELTGSPSDKQASYRQANTGKRDGAYTPFVVPSALQDRVAQVYVKLDEQRREVTKDPAQCFVPDEESDRAICDLLKGRTVTPKRMETLFKHLWNEPRNQMSGWFTREHMTVRYICQEYKKREMALIAAEQKDAAKGIMRTVGGYTFKPEEDDDEELTYVNLKDLNKGRKRA